MRVMRIGTAFFMTEQRYRNLVTTFLAGMLVLHLVLAWNARDLVRKGYPDFTIFYSAGKIVRQGLGSQLYNEAVQYRAQQEFASGVTIRQGPLPYNHPPFEALLFVPLTWLPYFPAYLVWNLLSLLILAWVGTLLRPHILILRRVAAPLWLLACLAFSPVYIAFLQGQDIIVLFLLYCLTYTSLKKNAEFAAGCYLGLGLFRFHLVVPFVFMMLFRRKLKFVSGVGLVGILLTMVSLAMVGGSGTIHYVQYVWHVEQTMGGGAIVPAAMPNLRGLIDTILPGRAPQLLREVATVVPSLALLLIASLKWRKAKLEEEVDLGFALCLVVTVLVSYHTFAYDMTLLLLPMALVTRGIHGEWVDRFLLIPVITLFCGPLLLFLWLHLGHAEVLSLVLLAWAWAIMKKMSRLALPEGSQ